MITKKTSILISIAVIALFITAITSASYAYYTSTINSEGESKTEVNTANVSARFTDGPEIIENNILPGTSITKTFSLENTGDIPLKYKVILKEVNNSFVKKQDITYQLKENNIEIKTGIFPSTNNAISDIINISPKETKNYTLIITYENTEESQLEDMGKTISGQLFIEEV